MQDYTNQPITLTNSSKPLGFTPLQQPFAAIGKPSVSSLNFNPREPVIVKKLDQIQNNRGKTESQMNSRQTSREASPINYNHHKRLSLQAPYTQQNSPRLLNETIGTVDRSGLNQSSFMIKGNGDQRGNSIDFIDRCPVTVQEIIKSNNRKTGNNSAFGIEYYQIPNTNIWNSRPRTTKFTTYKIPHFIDQYSKSREFVPGPKYETITNWKTQMKDKGAFSKSPRVTFTESILKEGKLKEQPGPGAYNHSNGFKVKKLDKGTAQSDKVCEFIEEARYRGISTPAPKYEPAFNRVDPDLKYARIHKTKNERLDKLQKDPTKPAPGDYDVSKAFEKTQTVNIKYKVGNQKIRCFVEEAQRAKSYLPGIGAYKVTNKAYDALSRSPVSMRKYRQ